MEAIAENLPWFVAMGILIGFSAFFSASEAALFYLRWQDRRALAAGNRAQRVAERLLNDPDRLLSAVLFWNLVINIAYFAITSIVGIQLEGRRVHHSSIVAFTCGSLLTIIFLSEMLPKSLAVLRPRTLAALVGIPLASAARVLDPIMPTLRVANLLSRRLMWPSFRPEPYLEVTDLERAVELSTSDAELIEQEQTVLRNIVSLSDIRVEEWMRPRRQFRVFRPPVGPSDLGKRMTPSGYLFVTEHASDEVAAALNLRELSDVRADHLEYDATAVIYVPWCSTVADTLEILRSKDREAAAIVNELGETIGTLTLEDILDTVFTVRPGRSERLLNHDPIQQVAPGTWQVTGMTNLRRVARHFDVELPASRSVTVGGVVQETLERLPEPGDECQWGPFRIRVIESPEDGPLLLQLASLENPEESSS